jgi:CheY-like chemotaxis protein
MSFESVPGEGTTFWFDLPAGPRAAARGAVLVIEDDPGTAALLEATLTADGYHVEVAASGEEALMRVYAAPPVAVCLDISLAGKLDGWDVLNRIKRRPETARVPVIVVSGSNDLREARALGAADVLAKPFDPADLVTTIRRLLPAGRSYVLIADDDPRIRKLVSETLAVEGLELGEAADGAAVLAALERRVPDALVLDLVMPGLDGFAVLDRMRDDPRTRLVPVIVLTGQNLTLRERAELGRRAAALVQKSAYSANELRRLIRQAIGPAGPAA